MDFELNDMQRQAVLYNDGPLLILAGAGSGKTRVITFKIAHLISQGVDPYNILAITFTNKTANEMKERTIKLVGESNVWISTFHSLCARILRMHINKLGYGSNFTIIDSKDTEALLKICTNDLNLDADIFLVKNTVKVISDNKNKMVTPDMFYATANDFHSKKIADIYNMYQSHLFRSNCVDFDDLINLTLRLFNEHPDIAGEYQSRFEYIMVDEYQDTNAAQYQLIKLLTAKHNKLCVVGDDDQSIYSWRGADINNILNFEKDFPNTKIIKLEQNYRSTQTILSAANALIENNLERKSKVLWTNNIQGDKISFFRANSYTSEAKFIASNISQGDYKNYAVLYRNNFQSRAIEDELVRKNIPYKIVGATKFYQRLEIKDLISYLKLINNPHDESSFVRVITTPKRNIGKIALSNINEYSRQRNISNWSTVNCDDFYSSYTGTKKVYITAVKKFVQDFNSFIEMSKTDSIHNLIRNIITEIEYDKYLQKKEEYFDRLQNIDEFLNKIYEYETTTPNSSLSDFLETISLVSDIDGYNETDNVVTLTTLHASKGLEFPVVFITGLDEDLFPGKGNRCMVKNNGVYSIEEERRLCYVGMTRAMRKLYLTSSRYRIRNGQAIKSDISTFAKEIPSQYITFNYESAFQTREVTQDEPTLPVYKPMQVISKPRDLKLEYAIGDTVRHSKYGLCKVKSIESVNADYQVTVEFDDGTTKIFMARLTNLSLV